MFVRGKEEILRHACAGVEIPSGIPTTLTEGTVVQVAQALGGTLTVVTDDGRLVRLDPKDADALGEAYAQVVRPAATAPEGPFEEERVWEELRTVYDPEIPVNIVDLGLIYHCEAKPLPEGGRRIEVAMTMTAPGCGMGGVLREDVRQKLLSVPGVREVEVELVWEPPWDPSRMSEAARLQLGWM